MSGSFLASAIGVLRPGARRNGAVNPPKEHLPGKGASLPAVGEGGCPFERGRVRDDLVLRARWKSAQSGADA